MAGLQFVTEESIEAGKKSIAEIQGYVEHSKKVLNDSVVIVNEGNGLEALGKDIEDCLNAEKTFSASMDETIELLTVYIKEQDDVAQIAAGRM